MRFCKNHFHGIIIIASALFLFIGDAHSQSSNDRIKKDLQLIELGNPKQALSDLSKLTTDSPKDPETHAALALAMIETGDINGAAKEVDIAYDKERKNVLVRIARAVLYGKQGKKSDAIEEFNKAIKINDKEIATFLYLARYYLSVDSLKPAEITLYRAQSVNANDVRPFIGLAELYEKQHSPDLAIQQYVDAKKVDPKDVTVIANLAQLYSRAKRYNDAVKEWDNLTKVDPNYSRAYYEMAHIYDISEDHINAAKYAEKYVALEPDNLDGIWLLARSLAESNQFEKALPYLEKAGKIDSMRANLYLARSYFFTKDYTKANQLYASSKNLTSYDLFYYGRSLIFGGDTTGGLEKWKQALQADTSGKAEEKLKIRSQIISYLNIQKKYNEIAAVYLDIAKSKNSADDYVSAGQFFNVANMPDQAQAAFEAALKINPKSIKAQVGLADVVAKNPEKLAAAEKMIDDAATNAVTPEDKEIIGNSYARLGIQFYTAKDYDGSAKVLENKSLKYLTGKSPFLINVYKVLGAAYLQVKNYKKSQEYYKKGQELSPDDEDIKKGLDFIKQMQGK
jgi:tetratricopeptide (TPR) repeat protein